MNGAMRVAFIVNRFPVLSQTFVLDQVTGLLDRGHQVDIYPTYGFGPEEATLHPDVLAYGLLERTHYTGYPSNHLARVLKGLGLLLARGSRHPAVLRSVNFARYGGTAASMVLLYSALPWLRQGPYDVIHCHFAPSGIIAVLLREIGALQGKIITTFHGYDVGSYPQKHGMLVYEPLFRMGDLYTANTRFTRDLGIALGCPSERIVTLPMGIDLSKFRFAPRQLLPGEPIKILTVGRLVEKKGIEYAVRAVARVAHGDRRIVYRIAGDGPLRGAIERLISDLHLGERVQLLGSKTKDEVRDLYADSHLFILSSVTASDGDKEGQGLVLQEAQATGLPVLSTLHNGIPDGVRDGESGFLVPERDVDALAARLTELVEHPDRWPAMGRAGRAHVEANYDVDRLTDRLVEIYRSLVTGAGTETGSATRSALDDVRERAERSA